VREIAAIEKAKRKQEAPASGLFLIILASLFLGVFSWGVLFFSFPPPVHDVDLDEFVEFTYDAPENFQRELLSKRAVALERMGLRTENTKWEMKDRFVFRTNNSSQDVFLEFVQVLKGPGALLVNEPALPKIAQKIRELKLNSALHAKILESEIQPIGNTIGVRSVVEYRSNTERFSALVYYIPAGTEHYWIFLGALAGEWDAFESKFEQFILSISGGKQGEGEPSKIPEFMFSPHRAILGGIIVFFFSFYIIIRIVFRDKEVKPGPKKPKAKPLIGNARQRH
jgi:hypothetical protein